MDVNFEGLLNLDLHPLLYYYIRIMEKSPNKFTAQINQLAAHLLAVWKDLGGLRSVPR